MQDGFAGKRTGYDRGGLAPGRAQRVRHVQKKHLSGFDIVHGHTWYGFYLGQLGANLRFPVLHSHHGGLNWPPYGHEAYPEGLRRAKFCMVAVSKWMQESYKKRHVWPGLNLPHHSSFSMSRNRIMLTASPYSSRHHASLMCHQKATNHY